MKTPAKFHQNLPRGIEGDFFFKRLGMNERTVERLTQGGPRTSCSGELKSNKLGLALAKYVKNIAILF